jgi:hypothetical protein
MIAENHSLNTYNELQNIFNEQVFPLSKQTIFLLLQEKHED